MRYIFNNPVSIPEHFERKTRCMHSYIEHKGLFNCTCKCICKVPGQGYKDHIAKMQ